MTALRSSQSPRTAGTERHDDLGCRGRERSVRERSTGWLIPTLLLHAGKMMHPGWSASQRATYRSARDRIGFLRPERATPLAAGTFPSYVRGQVRNGSAETAGFLLLHVVVEPGHSAVGGPRVANENSPSRSIIAADAHTTGKFGTTRGGWRGVEIAPAARPPNS